VQQQFTIFVLFFRRSYFRV